MATATNGLYRVKRIRFPNGEVYFTNRTDDRDSHKFIYHAVYGHDTEGKRSKINCISKQYGVCFVDTLWENLTEAEGNHKKKTLIEYHRLIGDTVINQE